MTDDIMDGFTSLNVQRGDEVWNAANESRRRDSKLSGEDSRRMRNAQSDIRKDIARVRREIAKESDPVSRRNLEAFEDRLTDLQRRMRQSNVVDGIREYNRRSSRMDALDEYVSEYKGKKRREEARSNGVKARSLPSNRMSGYMRKPGGTLDDFEDLDDDEWLWYPQLDDMFEELSEAIREYDSDQVRQIVQRITNFRKSHGIDSRAQDIDDFDETA